MSYETNDKMVSHPDHYKSGKYEVIDIIDEFCKDLTGTEAVCTANAIKYILRWKKKNGVQDIKKAVWYLTHLIETFTDEGLEDHAKFDEFRQEKMFTPGVSRSDCDTYHMEDNTSGGIKISEWEKASLASQGFKKIMIHHMDGRPDEVIDISELAPEPEKSIDDEPEPLNLRKNAAGVYIPKDTEEYATKGAVTKDVEVRMCKNCKYGHVSSIKDRTYFPCIGYNYSHHGDFTDCKSWEFKKEDE